MRKDFDPLGFTRTPKPRSSLSHANTSRPGSGRSASTVRFVTFGIVAARSVSASPRLHQPSGEALGKHGEANPGKRPDTPGQLTPLLCLRNSYVGKRQEIPGNCEH